MGLGPKGNREEVPQAQNKWNGMEKQKPPVCVCLCARSLVPQAASTPTGSPHVQLSYISFNLFGIE